MLNIVLHEPEIPANTGNIGRTCVATGTRLHLIEPLGFRLNEKALKRAGMDYWKDLDVRTYIDFEDFLAQNPGAKLYMATTKAEKVYILPLRRLPLMRSSSERWASISPSKACLLYTSRCV